MKSIFSPLKTSNLEEIVSNSQYYVGSPQVIVQNAPVHRPIHVVEPRPRHFVHPEPVVVVEQPVIKKPIIDPFRDEEAKEIAKVEEENRARPELVISVEQQQALQHNQICHPEDPTYLHDVDFTLCPCHQDVAAPVQFFEHGEERKKTVGFIWWMIPLLVLGLLLIGKFHNKKGI